MDKLWPGDAEAERAYRAEQADEADRQLRRALWGLVVMVGAVIGAVMLVVWYYANRPPDTRIVRVEVATVRAHAAALPRYPGATVLAQQDVAGVTTLTAQWKADHTWDTPGHNPLYSFEGYTGAAVPGTATQLFTVHAAAAQLGRWYREALLRRGWYVAIPPDTMQISGIPGSETEVTYANGDETFQLDYGSSDLVSSNYGDDPRSDVADVADPPNAPLAVYTQYALYPPDAALHPSGGVFGDGEQCALPARAVAQSQRCLLPTLQGIATKVATRVAAHLGPPASDGPRCGIIDP